MDRNFYRTEEDQQLIEEAKYNPNSELAVVLAERLDDVLLDADSDLYDANARAADFERDCNRLDDEKYELECEIVRMEAIIDGMAAEIQQLKETAK
jgi:cob(I)alamin adenosyltransferase